jgi:hypothetical protein
MTTEESTEFDFLLDWEAYTRSLEFSLEENKAAYTRDCAINYIKATVPHIVAADLIHEGIPSKMSVRKEGWCEGWYIDIDGMFVVFGDYVDCVYGKGTYYPKLRQRKPFSITDCVSHLTIDKTKHFKYYPIVS